MLTSGGFVTTMGINTLIIRGSSRELWVSLVLDTRDKEIRHVFIQGGDCHLVLVVDIGGRFRVGATGQSLGAFDLSLEVTT